MESVTVSYFLQGVVEPNACEKRGLAEFDPLFICI